MLSRIYLPIVLALNIITYVLNSLHVCLLSITKIIANITFENFFFFFSQNHFKGDYMP